MFKYSEFLSAVKEDGLSQQNRFFISLSQPSLAGTSGSLFNGGSSAALKLHMFCNAVQVPGVSIISTPMRTIGEEFNAPYDRSFSPASLSFHVDHDMIIRQFFEDWVNTIQNPTTRALGYYKDYVAPDLSIYVLDKNDAITYIMVLYEVMPKSIGDLHISNDMHGTMLMDVSLDYKFHATYSIPSPPYKKTDYPKQEYGTYGTRDIGGQGVLSAISKQGGSSTETAVPSAQTILQQASTSVNQGAAAFRNTIGSTFGTVRNSIAGYQNDFLGFQRSIGGGLGELNAVASDIRAIVNAPRDALNSARSTMRDIASAGKNIGNVFRF